jgi:hypothetical protein
VHQAVVVEQIDTARVDQRQQRHIQLGLGELGRLAIVDEAFLTGLRDVIQQGRDAMAGLTSLEYGPTLIATLPAVKKQGIRKQDLQLAMERLLAGNKIHIGKTDGPPSKAKNRINLGPSADGLAISGLATL